MIDAETFFTLLGYALLFAALMSVVFWAVSHLPKRWPDRRAPPANTVKAQALRHEDERTQ